MRGMRVAALVAAGLLLTACDPAPQPVPSSSPSTAGEVIRVSNTPGKDIDRPSFPPSNAAPDGFTAAPAGDDLSGYLSQNVQWKPCDPFECASIKVPLDYGAPGKQAITLTMARQKATATPKLGTLFINPGGPGGSGIDLLAGFNSNGLEQYDIIGWDPRGTGQSTPVKCYGDAETDALNALDSSPDTPAETDALVVGSYEFGKSCWEHSGELLAHISTIDTVRDLDLLRALMGDSTLHYLGYSYGTQIGAYYAELFPQNTGRLVLDAAVDITDDESVIQAMGFDLALSNFAAWCASQKCDLGSSKQGILDSITTFLDSLDAKPIRVGDRTLTQGLAATGIAAYLYGGIPAWDALAADIDAAMNGRGARLLRASDLLNDRSEDGHYGSMFYSFIAISCADNYDKGVADAEQQWAKDQKKAPIFAKYFGPGVGCPVWPVRSQVQLDIRGQGAKPLLVIGATGDPATPYQQAVTMAERLKSGVLVTYEGEGHGTFGNNKSSCVDRIVIDYLTRGKVPKDGTRCR